jgi:mannosyltransferase PIG-V
LSNLISREQSFDRVRRLRAGLSAVAWRLALLALGFRAFSAALAFLTNVLFPEYQDQGFTMWGTPSPFWDTFVRFDSGWFYQIARNGYRYTPDARDTIAYFPVYPLLMRYVGRLFGRTGGDTYLGGIVVAWAAFVLAIVAIYHLARLDLPHRRAERAALYISIFPFAFFFGVVYTESLFLLFTVLSFYGFRTRHWLLGGLCGALATATRVNGILMLPALAWIAWRSAEPRPRDRLLAAAGLALVCCGIGAYSLYIYRLTSIPGGSHNPFEWAAAVERWGYHPGGAPWLALARLASALVTRPYAYLAGEKMAPYDTLNGLAAIVFVLAVPFVWKRLGAGYGLFVLANLWLPLSSGQYEGMGRYCAVMFPVFIWLASVRSRWVATAVIVASAMLYAVCLALFTNTHPLF